MTAELTVRDWLGLAIAMADRADAQLVEARSPLRHRLGDAIVALHDVRRLLETQLLELGAHVG